MKKAEAISILATSARPREPKDRARYDEAVRMAIEALKCSETPKSSEQTAESTQNVSDEDFNWAIPSASLNLVPASVVAGIGQELLHLEEDMHRITQLTGISIDDLLDLLAQGYELKAPSAQPQIIRCKDCKHRDKYGCCKYWKGLAMGDIPIATDDYDFCSYAKRI